MAIIAIANSKGGSGKTATVFNLGSQLARRGHKVLLWDMDPQASLSACFKVEFPQTQVYCEDILATDKIDPNQAPVEIGTNLFVIPATEGLAGLEGQLRHTEKDLFRLKRSIERLKHLKFDYILFDPPGSTDIFMAAVLIAADQVLIPARPTDNDFTALIGFRSTVEKAKELNHELVVKGILFNQVILSSKNEAIYRSFFAGDPWEKLICKTAIRMATAVANAPGTGKDVIAFEPKSKVAEDYKSLAVEVESWN